ncbi:molecular chaperone [Frateuria edaphi]|uniref:fimbrial biogenesis chaperone n=1 Tax=Frateuria edaphi TaxID=2898793 RepID=UPI001E2953BA|nr:molecular chaperone [Frateuria edaphi]UGB45832.1 molecular chaperone [Frateuria edaphi]
MKSLVRAIRGVVAALCLCALPAHASVVIGGTRVVFPARDGEVTVRLSNDSAQPALVEAWIDRGDPHSTPDKVDVPFLITPPLFRMEPHKDQSLRIIATQANLPADRESLFWLNVLEIPPKPKGAEFAGKNLLQFAIRSRLKFFYRPANLPGDLAKAPAELTWKAVPDGAGYALEVHNPTAYHITVIKASLDIAGKPYSADTGMVDPLGTLRLPVTGLTKAPATGTPVAYDIVNDYGAAAPYQGSIAP